jgi:hypothetical protein
MYNKINNDEKNSSLQSNGGGGITTILFTGCTTEGLID